MPDEAKWQLRRNQGMPRQQSVVMNGVIDKQVQKLLAAGCIQRSRALYYSQVHLVAKKIPVEARDTISADERLGFAYAFDAKGTPLRVLS